MCSICASQVRAVRHIREGEEILFCYSRLGDEFRSRARRAYLQVFENELLDLLFVVETISML